jgi:hypothetical protein
MVLVPLFDLKFLEGDCCAWCRNFKSAALEKRKSDHKGKQDEGKETVGHDSTPETNNRRRA